MARVFVYDGREMPDHDPEASVEDVQKQLTNFYPEIANARVTERDRGEDKVFEFVRQVGTKG